MIGVIAVPLKAFWALLSTESGKVICPAILDSMKASDSIEIAEQISSKPKL